MRASSGHCRLVLEVRDLLVAVYVSAASESRPGWHWWLSFDESAAAIDLSHGLGAAYGTEATWAQAYRAAWRAACRVKRRKGARS